MWGTILLVTTLQTINMPDAGFSCDFPAVEPTHEGISLTVWDRPSLKDQPGLYRVELQMNGNETLLATAQPITSTNDRDAIVLARPTKETLLSIGFREDGAAAMWMQMGVEASTETRIGTCRGFEGPLSRWLAS